MGFGKSNAKLLNQDQTKVTFKDVAGIEEAREEVEEAIVAIKRKGEMRDIANVIDFFIAEASDFVTGQVLFLGGVS